MSSTNNPYGYTSGNPVNSSDPSGLFCIIGSNPGGGCRDGDVLNKFNRNFNPALQAELGYYYEYQVSKNGASNWQSAGDALRAVVGVTGTAAAGGAEIIDGALAGIGDGVTTVTSWAPAAEDANLAEPRWVQVGDATRTNFWKTGLPGGKFSLSYGWQSPEASFVNYITADVPNESLSWPSGAEWVKGFLGQRIYTP